MSATFEGSSPVCPGCGATHPARRHHPYTRRIDPAREAAFYAELEAKGIVPADGAQMPVLRDEPQRRPKFPTTVSDRR